VCYREIWVSRKIRALSFGNLLQTLDFENFATASRSCCQQKSSTVELVDDTYRVGQKTGPQTHDQQKRDCLVHFARLAITLLKDGESARDNHVLGCNIYARCGGIFNMHLITLRKKTPKSRDAVERSSVNSQFTLHTAL